MRTIFTTTGLIFFVLCVNELSHAETTDKAIVMFVVIIVAVIIIIACALKINADACEADEEDKEDRE